VKIRKITLKDVEIKEVNGEFERVYTNEKTYPAFLTNYALKKGKELGLIESSLFSDLLKLQGLQRLESIDKGLGDIDPSVFESIDETKMMKVIYLAFIGANKNTALSFDEFLEKYHAPLEEMMDLYMNLIADLMSSDKNQFAAALRKSMNTKQNGKKSNHRR
jgi:hypothetical protein